MCAGLLPVTHERHLSTSNILCAHTGYLHKCLIYYTLAFEMALKMGVGDALTVCKSTLDFSKVKQDHEPEIQSVIAEMKSDKSIFEDGRRESFCDRATGHVRYIPLNNPPDVSPRETTFRTGFANRTDFNSYNRTR